VTAIWGTLENCEAAPVPSRVPPRVVPHLKWQHPERCTGALGADSQGTHYRGLPWWLNSQPHRDVPVHHEQTVRGRRVGLNSQHLRGVKQHCEQSVGGAPRWALDDGNTQGGGGGGGTGVQVQSKQPAKGQGAACGPPPA